MIYNIILIFTANIALGRRALLVSNEIRLYPKGILFMRFNKIPSHTLENSFVCIS